MRRLLPLMWFGCAAPADTGPSDSCDEGLDVGQCAPAFTLPDAQGVPWSLESHRGEVVVVEISGFW